jgi:hypothetical protein
MLSFHQSVRKETSFSRTSIDVIDLGHCKNSFNRTSIDVIDLGRCKSYKRNYPFSVYYENKFKDTKLIPPISEGL